MWFASAVPFRYYFIFNCYSIIITKSKHLLSSNITKCKVLKFITYSLTDHSIIRFNTMTQKLYTWKDVADHKTETDLWIVINDKVYNVTEYVN